MTGSFLTLWRSPLTLTPPPSLQTELISPAHYGTSVAEEILNVPLSMTHKHRLVKRESPIRRTPVAGG